MRIQTFSTAATSAFDRLDKKPATIDATTIAPGATSEGVDELTLSDEAQALADAPRMLTSLPHTEGDFQEQYDARLGEVQARLQSLFAKNGIDTSPPIRLQTASDGRVIVAGHHPQKKEIEQFFVDDRDLRNDFVATAAQGEFLRAFKEAVEFQQAYRKDPKAAVERFKHLFQERHDVFTLKFDGDSATPTFELP